MRGGIWERVELPGLGYRMGLRKVREGLRVCVQYLECSRTLNGSEMGEMKGLTSDISSCRY